MTKPKFNLRGYKAMLAKMMQEELKIAIRRWLDATVRSRVPTWSGASRATFEKIAKEADTMIEYGPQRSLKDRKSLGRSESKGELHIGQDTGIYYFYYETTLRYFILNEHTHQTYKEGARDTGSGVILYKKGLRYPGPYNLQGRGAPALEAALVRVKLPNPYLFLSGKKI